MEYKKLNEIYSFLNYTPPYGDMEIVANVDLIFNSIISKLPYAKLELTTKEFSIFMTRYSNEVLISLLLDDRQLPINKALKEGFDFRGITIRVQ